MEDAGTLIEHYDRWLEEYAARREAPGAESDTSPVFMADYPFPEAARERFKTTFDEMRRDLYETDAPQRGAV